MNLSEFGERYITPGICELAATLFPEGPAITLDGDDGVFGEFRSLFTPRADIAAQYRAALQTGIRQLEASARA